MDREMGGDAVRAVYLKSKCICPQGFPLRKREWAEFGEVCGKQCETCPVKIRGKKEGSASDE